MIQEVYSPTNKDSSRSDSRYNIEQVRTLTTKLKFLTDGEIRNLDKKY